MKWKILLRGARTWWWMSLTCRRCSNASICKSVTNQADVNLRITSSRGLREARARDSRIGKETLQRASARSGLSGWKAVAHRPFLPALNAAQTREQGKLPADGVRPQARA